MKKIQICMLIAIIVASVWVYVSREEEPPKSIQVGVSLYMENDTFLEGIVEAMEAEALLYEETTGISVDLNVSVANGSQREQNEQVKRYINLGYDAICVNLVDRTSAATIVDMAEVGERQIPVVFFNREPVEEDILRRENVYYVGSEAKESAIFQGNSVVDAYAKYGDIMDKNGDGILQYVMLEGEFGHQDAIIRSDYSVQTIEDMGVTLKKLETGTADWNRQNAYAMMGKWLDIHGDAIELVLCNNDDMALGALDVLTEREMTASVFGIDATDAGLEALDAGLLWATVDCNAEDQGCAIIQVLTSSILEGTAATTVSYLDGRYVRSEIFELKSEFWQ